MLETLARTGRRGLPTLPVYCQVPSDYTSIRWKRWLRLGPSARPIRIGELPSACQLSLLSKSRLILPMQERHSMAASTDIKIPEHSAAPAKILQTPISH